ncbi:hypothetical protein [Micropruina sp.]|uniref:hypothetical protein n=1 Tax=Micropruina sp. TaxID=2737536 RepID=UPI0039E6D754
MRAWRLLRSSRWASHLIAASLTLVALLPLLARLPRVAVVACFDTAHPLYTLVETHAAGNPANCVTAPAPVVTWTLMVAATLLVQAVLLPAGLFAAAVLLRHAHRLAEAGRQLLALIFGRLATLVVVVSWPAAPAPIPVAGSTPAHRRSNPRRGPPRRS